MPFPIRRLAPLAAAVALALTLAACGDDPSDADQGLQPPATTAPPSTTARATTTGAPTTAPAGPTTTRPFSVTNVRIGDFSFGPANITVASGVPVTWTNADPVPHSVVLDDGSARSGTIGPNQTFQYAFPKTGTFKYFCGIHNYMTGSVTVTAAPATTAGATSAGS